MRQVNMWADSTLQYYHVQTSELQQFTAGKPVMPRASRFQKMQSGSTAARFILTFDDVLLQHLFRDVPRHGGDVRWRVVSCGTQAMRRSAACESHAMIQCHEWLQWSCASRA